MDIFRVIDTDVDLDGNTFWIGGIRAELSGVINNTPPDGAVAAVIGIDANSGTAQSWGGYFEGKGHFSDKVLIGTKEIPSMADTSNVSHFNLFVTGGILTEDVVLQNESEWADYVFGEDYDLKSLYENSAIYQHAWSITKFCFSRSGRKIRNKLVRYNH